ncbi:MAG TPA: hypothetical protein VMI10_19565 [Terriglobales bacterium]|nr:hypothetical protein [Terriglobales bacterium]
MLEIIFGAFELLSGLAIAFLQFTANPSRYRWYVLGLIGVIFICSLSVRIIEKQRREKAENDFEQFKRDLPQLISKAVSDQHPPTLHPAGAVEKNEISAHDPRVYPISVKEPEEAIFPKSPFVLTNYGGDVAHKVRIQMLFKLRGRNVAFNTVEVLPAGGSVEVLPEIEDESLSTKHDIFHWLLADWNGDSRGISEDWPKPVNIHWSNHQGKEFTTAATLVFHPIKYLLKRNTDWTKARNYTTIEFTDIRFT